MQFKTKPYDHQLEAFEKFKDDDYFAIFADMGTGKTKMSIDIAAYKYLKGEIKALLIIAPNNVHTQWLNEQLPMHCPINYKPFSWDAKSRGRKTFHGRFEDFINDDFDGLKVMAVNVEAFQSDAVVPYVATLVKRMETFIIIDESTKIKNPNAKRTKMIHRLSKYGKRAILTGTPATKSPFDLWSQFNFLKADYFGCNYHIFQHRYGVLMTAMNHQRGTKFTTLIDEKTFRMVKNKIKKIYTEYNITKLESKHLEYLAITYGISLKNIIFIETSDKFKRFKRLDELKFIIEPDTFTARKDECLDLPPKIYEKKLLEMSKEQQRVYKELKQHYLTLYADKQLSVLNKVSLATRLMQICGGFFPYDDKEKDEKILTIEGKNLKLETMIEDIDELPDNEQILIWANFVAEIELLENELSKKYSVVAYYGKLKQHQRARVIDEFKSGMHKIMIINPAVGAHGLNLQNAKTQMYYSNNFRTENRLQAEDRSHRSGVKGVCVYIDYVYKNTMDERVFQVIKEGKDLNDYFRASDIGEF